MAHAPGTAPPYLRTPDTARPVVKSVRAYKVHEHVPWSILAPHTQYVKGVHVLSSGHFEAESPQDEPPLNFRGPPLAEQRTLPGPDTSTKNNTCERPSSARDLSPLAYAML